MKTVYTATLLAAATIMICGMAQAGSRNHAELGGSFARIGEPRSGITMPQFPPPGSRFNMTQGQRLPVLMLTSSRGMVGEEMLAGGASGYRLRDFPYESSRAIVYVDVDTFDARSRLNRNALQLAREAGWPIVLESETWNVRRLHATVRSLFPDLPLGDASEIAVMIDWRNPTAPVRDISPTEAALAAGVPFEATTEGGLAGNAVSVAKAGRHIHWSAKFAKAAYEAQPGDQTIGVDRLRLIVNRTAVKVWVNDRNRECIVSWRGSTDTADWLTNIRNIVANAALPGAILVSPNVRIGNGYASRLRNEPLDTWMTDCTGGVWVTGHSLGGGMAQVYALREMLQSTGRGETPQNIRGVFAYNPSRVGNQAFADWLQNLMINFPESGRRRELQTYCRHGDPVWSLPAGLKHGTSGLYGTQSECTYWAPKLNWNSPIANHTMGPWLNM
jgi:hypothetical protein